LELLEQQTYVYLYRWRKDYRLKCRRKARVYGIMERKTYGNLDLGLPDKIEIGAKHVV
jgi:hypothetical protein